MASLLMNRLIAIVSLVYLLLLSSKFEILKKLYSQFFDTEKRLRTKLIEHFTLHFSYAKDFAVSFLFFIVFV